MVKTNRAQREALYKLYQRNSNGINTYRQFRKGVMPGFGDDSYIGIMWCGMFVGIEEDGYSHT